MKIIIPFFNCDSCNTPISNLQKEWLNTGYKLPFLFVKDIMNEKGYHIESFSNKTHPTMVNDR